MYKIPQNCKLTKFRAVQGSDMKGKMKAFEQLRCAVQGGHYLRNKMET